MASPYMLRCTKHFSLTQIHEYMNSAGSIVSKYALDIVECIPHRMRL